MSRRRRGAQLFVAGLLGTTLMVAPAGAGAPATSQESLSPVASLAEQFRPRLYFDRDEKWRPLDVDGFLSSGQARICRSQTDCELATPDAFARPAKDYLDIDGSLDMVSSYRSLDPLCVRPPLLDCDTGRATALNFRIVSHQGYRYIDYWVYYRVNHFGIRRYDHESDWEGLTVAVPRHKTTPSSFDFVVFSAHGKSWRYLRKALLCEEEPKQRCGRTAKRVSAFIARGSHASYPRKCPGVGGFCRQTGRPLPERPFDGGSEWGANDDPATLRPFRGQGWLRWAGTWDIGRHVKSPGNQDRFKRPWSARCSGRFTPGSCWARERGRKTGNDPCAAWIGPFTTAVACEPTKLEKALAAGRLKPGKGVTFKGAPVIQSVTVSGLSQAIGYPLRPEEMLTLEGDPAPSTKLAIHAENKKYEVTALFDKLGLDRTGKAELLVTAGRRTPNVFIRPVGTFFIRPKPITPTATWVSRK